ncbi:hypothetical protein ACJ41O_010264 [Fusarium nematophilum]
MMEGCTEDSQTSQDDDYSGWDTAGSGYSFICSGASADNERCLPERYHPNFVSCFCLAHQLGVDFVNITWQPAKGPLGPGTSSIVNEAHMMTKQLNFAFKRTAPRRGLQPQGVPSGAAKNRFRALTSELLALRNTAIRDHPNVARLEGIAWEFHDHHVWPVLVFPRADRGTLDEFVNSNEGKGAPFEAKLQICFDIGLALDALHNSLMVHADVKPSNVLVFLVDETYVAKLTDFESSCICTSEDDLVTLPRTEPWDAPEWHHRQFTMRDAKRMEIYSYQLVTFFALFQASLDVSIVDALPELKANNALPGLVNAILGQWSDLTPYQNSCLSQFFKAGLATDPEDREVDIEALLRLLSFDAEFSLRSTRDAAAGARMEYPDPHELDSIISAFSQLGRGDYRVRRFLTASLEEAAYGESCAACAPSAAFALAFGWEVGLFVRENEDDLEELLAKSHRSPEEFCHLVAEFCQNLDPQQPISRVIEGYQTPWSHNFIESYRADGVLSEAEEFLRKEVNGRSLIPGQDHILTRDAKLSLMLTLSESYRWEEAQELLQQVLQSCQRVGDRTGAALAKESLAILNANRGRWTEAEDAMAEVLDEMSKVGGEKGVLALDAMERMTSIYHGQAKYAEAVRMSRTVVAGFDETLGPDHPRTVSAMESLAKSLAEHGELGEALQKMEVVIDWKKRIVGDDSRSTLSSMAHLALIRSRMGGSDHAIVQLKSIIGAQTDLLGSVHDDTLRSEESLVQCHILRGESKAALAIQESLAEKKSRLLGARHPSTLRCRLNFATLLGNAGFVDLPVGMSTAVVKDRAELLGEGHPDTISARCALSSAFRKTGLLKEAEELGKQALGDLRATCGERSPLTLSAMESLAAVYASMGRMGEAAELLGLALNTCTDLYGPESPGTLRLTLVYASAVPNAAEAEALRHRVLGIQRRQLGEVNASILMQENKAATGLMRQSRWDEARSILERILPNPEQALGRAHSTSLTTLSNLAICQGELGNWEFARGSLQRVVDALIEELGLDDPHTLHHRANLASILMRTDRLGEAEASAGAVVVDMKRVHGENHPETMRVMNNLAAVYARREKWAQAHTLLERLVEMAAAQFGYDDPRTGDYREQADAMRERLPAGGV